MPERSTPRAALGAALEERIALLAPARRLRFALTLDLIARYADRRTIRVLDAGCGDGLLSLALADLHPSWEVVGVDLREELLAGARDRARSQGLVNVSFICSDLVKPPPQTGFDAVLAIECLEEIPDDQAALRMMTSALVPEGLLVVHVPERSWRPVLPGSSPIWRDEVRHGYSLEQLAEALHCAGLTSVEVRPTMRGTVAVAQELRDRLKNKPVGVRALAFPAMVGAVRLERWGITWGPDRALLATARRPPSSGPASPG